MRDACLEVQSFMKNAEPNRSADIRFDICTSIMLLCLKSTVFFGFWQDNRKRSKDFVLPQGWTVEARQRRDCSQIDKVAAYERRILSCCLVD